MKPTLVVVCGSQGAGKTTLAHEIARAIGCPAIIRDELKEGMVRSYPGFTPATNDPLTMRTFSLFFDVLQLLLQADVTLVAEAAFQGKVWAPNLEPLAALADMRIVECVVDDAVRHARWSERDAKSRIRRAAHAHSTLPPFNSIPLAVPALKVDTSDGYAPSVEQIVAFILRR